MSNEYFIASSVPARGATGSSAVIRAEYGNIEDGFDKLPTMSGNATKLLAVNGSATALTAVTLTTGAIVVGGASGIYSQVSPGTTGQILQANTSAAPSYSTATYPSTVTANRVLYATGTDAVGTSGNLTFNGSTLTVTGSLSVSGTITYSGLTASQAVFTDASKNLVSNAITGSGNVVMSASPTFTGTITGAIANWSGLSTFSAGIALSGTASNLSLGSNYINNSGATTDEGISIASGGAVTMSAGLTVGGNVTLGANSIGGSGTGLSFSGAAATFSSTLGVRGVSTFSVGTQYPVLITDSPSGGTRDMLRFETLAAGSGVGIDATTTGQAAYTPLVLRGSSVTLNYQNTAVLAVGSGAVTITGTGTFTDTVTSTRSSAGSVFTAASGGTNYYYMALSNTSGGIQIGLEGSGAGTLMTNDTAYAAIINTTVNKPVQIGVNSVLIGNFTSTGLTVTGSVVATTTASGTFAAQMWNQATSGDNSFISFYTEGGGGSLRGSITYNRGGGVVAYNTTSDRRSKDLFGEFANSGAMIDSVAVYLGQMKGAKQKRPMFVADELQRVAPWAVTGEKDAVNEKGEPVMQQVDHQVLIPALWAEVKSLRARVAQLENK